mmetsp:Transcript_2803/g.7119  ORF Transcript_2803/g.7119 Transcript_2803/m.7119 type:complete len:1134 (+) Transcript_2803:91-3492(+)
MQCSSDPDNGGETSCWEHFILNHLVWPTIVQAGILVALQPLSFSWCRWHLADTPILLQYIGKKERKPENPYFLATLLMLQLVSSMASVIDWVRGSYVKNAAEHWGDAVMAALFILGYLVRMVKNELCTFDALTLACIIDVYTTAPIFFDRTKHAWLSLKFIRVYRAMDAFQQIDKTGVVDCLSDFRKALLFLILRAICMIIVLSGIVFTLEVLGEIPSLTEVSTEVGMGDISFVQMVYFTMSTISTVGYGDFTPSTLPARAFVCLEIFVGVIFFSVETTTILQLQNLLNTGKGSYHARAKTKHVLIIGGGVHSDGEVLTTLLQEIFSIQHKSEGWPDVVMLSPVPQNQSLKERLNSLPAEKRRKMSYFLGSPMLRKDLSRVALQNASMVYVLASVTAQDKSQEDGFNMLRALSVKKFNPYVKLRLMLLRPEFKERAVNAGIDGEHCFSVDEMKATFMAHCCRCPGFIAVVSNLTDSDQVARESWSRHAWMRDYLDGSNNAIYGVLLSPEFEGLSWNEVTWRVYESVGAILVAAQVDGRVILNPSIVVHETLGTNEVAFVIASSLLQLGPVKQARDWLTVFTVRKKRASAWMSEPDVPCNRRRSKPDEPIGLHVDHVEPMHGLTHAATNAVSLKHTAEKVGGHIVLMPCSSRGVHWNAIALMLATLRTPLRAWEHKLVMVLTQEEPPASIAEAYKDVSFIVGDASNFKDLELACITKASVVVLLAGDADGGVIAELRDHSAVVAAHQLDLMLGAESSSQAFVMYELHNESSAVFVPPPLNIISPESQCGDSMHTEDDDVAELAIKMQTQFACGQVFSLSYLGRMLGREYYVPATMELLQALVMPARRGQTSFPWLVDVPPEFVGDTFESLFLAWTRAKDAATPIGLYSNVPDARAPYGCVVTNPKKGHRLGDQDRVYVLASDNWGKRLLSPSMVLSPEGKPSWREELSAVSTSAAPAAGPPAKHNRCSALDMVAPASSEGSGTCRKPLRCRTIGSHGPGYSAQLQVDRTPAQPNADLSRTSTSGREGTRPSICELRALEKQRQVELMELTDGLRTTEATLHQRIDRLEGELQKVVEIIQDPRSTCKDSGARSESTHSHGRPMETPVHENPLPPSTPQVESPAFSAIFPGQPTAE